MRKGYIYTLLLIVIFLNSHKAFSQNVNTSGCGCDFVIRANEEYIDGAILGAGPGDVICIEASTKRYLGFINFHGTAAKPIIFKNCGGRVIVRNTDWYYGIKFDDCSFFKFTGTGSSDTYGFLIDGTPDQIAGLGVAKMSTDFEIDHIEVSRTGFAGIIAKSDPDCSGVPNQGNFVQRNTIVHHNYIHDTGGEGIYLGFPHYRGVKRDCGGPDSVRILPHDLVGVKVYNNRIDRTGKEGLQVGCAVEDVDIYENVITNFGMNNSRYQRAGVHFSTGTTGKFHRNYISTGTGPGIWLNGIGGNYIFNNVIVNAGKSGEDGIMIHDSVVADGKSYNIINNTIVNAGANGVKVYTQRNTILNFCNNVIGGAGAELVSVPGSVVFNNTNNVADNDPRNMFFLDYDNGNYRLSAISPAVDAGMNASSYDVIMDYDYVVRPMGKAYDAGAYESPFERLMIGFFVYPNPVHVATLNLPPTSNVSTVFIRFVLAKEGPGSLRVYDTQGRVVATIAQGNFEAAKEYKIEFNSYFLAPGLYFYVLESINDTQVKKIIQIE